MREYGYAPKGKQVEDVKCGKKFHKTNVIGGLFNGKVLAPHCYEHSTTGVFFEWWLVFGGNVG
ncbi:MAG: transposase [Candidatus Bathyarchaeota archaeon]|nr:transposase [Candidatus Termiticorpusculum sp.]